MSEHTDLIDVPRRPRGLVPGTMEWLREVQGPKIIKRMVDEIEAQPVGEMNPTGARLCVALADRFLPTLSATHHTLESDLSRRSVDELKDELRRLLSDDAETVEFIEAPEQQKVA